MAAVNRHSELMYTVAGDNEMDEQVLEHLEGYKGSAPVRIGNNAYAQLQLDIYGELLDAVYLFNKYGKPIFLWFLAKSLPTDRLGVS